MPLELCKKCGRMHYRTNPCAQAAKKSTAALSQMRCAELFSYDKVSGILSWRVAHGTARAGDRAGTKKPSGYRMVLIDGRGYQEHRIIWTMERGSLPADGREIDHRNQVRDDNRWDNLREATKAEQQINSATQKNNKHGRGVDYRADRKKWRATIYVGGKAVSLGTFDTKEEAQAAYRAGAIKHYGEFVPDQAPSVDTKPAASSNDRTSDIKSENTGSTPVVATNRNADRHKPGYWADYMRKRRAKEKDA